jgi:hypothetical protein
VHFVGFESQIVNLFRHNDLSVSLEPDSYDLQVFTWGDPDSFARVLSGLWSPASQAEAAGIHW